MRARFTIENLKIRTAHKTYFLLEKERSRLCIFVQNVQRVTIYLCNGLYSISKSMADLQKANNELKDIVKKPKT